MAGHNPKLGSKSPDGLGGRLSSPDGPVRLYQKLVRHLLDELAAGRYSVGDRLPAERELSAVHGVSRPAVREAILALEVLGLVEVRVGSGAYVVRLPHEKEEPGFTVSAFELMEARLLMEGEAAALAAIHVTDQEIAELQQLVEMIFAGNRRRYGAEDADHAFHRVIARATRNAAIERMVEELWNLRSASPECALLLDKARTANVQPIVDEHTAIVEALRSRDPAGARKAMRAHLSAVIDHLLFSIEEDAVAEARRSVASTRERYSRTFSI